MVTSVHSSSLKNKIQLETLKQDESYQKIYATRERERERDRETERDRERQRERDRERESGGASLTICQIFILYFTHHPKLKSLSLQSSHFRKFHASPLVNKQNFLV